MKIPLNDEWQTKSSLFGIYKEQTATSFNNLNSSSSTVTHGIQSLERLTGSTSMDSATIWSLQFLLHSEERTTESPTLIKANFME